MREKTLTLVQQALEQVEGFAQSYERFVIRLRVEQKSSTTIEEYSRKIASLSLHYMRLPEDLTVDQIDSYLVRKQQEGRSNSMFKHIVFGLRAYFKALGLERQTRHLPSIKKTHKLPEVLNYDECKRLFRAPKLLKHRVMLSP
jgi:site-specific recombinase XerD